MEQGIFPYQLVKRKERKDSFNQLIQYSFVANDIGSNKTIDYLINFYRYKNNLYIIDFFPAKWNNQSDASNKILSKEEDIQVNFRKIIKTCFMVFHNEIGQKEINAAMVITASLTKNERNLPEKNYSRKLKLYESILLPVASSLKYKTIRIYNENTIIFTKAPQTKNKEQIESDFLEFKHLSK